MVVSTRMNRLELALISILSLVAVGPSTCFSPQQREGLSVGHSSSNSRFALYQAKPMIGTLASGANPMRKKKLQTFVRYLEVECWKRSELRELEPTLQAIADACKQINRIVQRAQTDDLYGVAVDKDGNPLEETNVQGEVQQKLDVVCNTIMMRAFCGSSKSIHSVASEEEDEVCKCSDIMVSLVGMPSVTCFCICVYHTPLVLRLGEYIYVSD
jgi:hypothetical protein